jgi:hypothetical protein
VKNKELIIIYFRVTGVYMYLTFLMKHDAAVKYA